MVLEEHGAIELAGIRFQVAMFEEALSLRPDDCDALRYLSHAYAVLGRHADGLATDRRLVDLLPRDPRARYNLACSNALAGHREEAIARLSEAVQLGFSDVVLLRKDRDLDSLRDDPRYAEIEAEVARRARK